MNQHIYLNHASIFPLQPHVKQALLEFLDIYEKACFSYYQTAIDLSSKIKESLAQIIKCPTTNIALTPNTATSISLLINGLTWHPGDEVILLDHDFPSVTLATVPLQKKGVLLKIVSEKDFIQNPIEALAQTISTKTRLLLISLVGFNTGFHAPISQITSFCKSKNILCAIDGTQAIGAVPFNFKESGIDFLAVSCYKWLMGPVGTAFFACSDTLLEHLTPSIIGWLSQKKPHLLDATTLQFPESAQKFESGGKALLSLVGTRAALAYIEVRGASIIEQTQKNALYLYKGLRNRGFSLTNSQFINHPSSIVSIDTKKHGAALHSFLDAHQITTTYRLDTLRFSPGFYQCPEDLHYLFDCLYQYSKNNGRGGGI